MPISKEPTLQDTIDYTGQMRDILSAWRKNPVNENKLFSHLSAFLATTTEEWFEITLSVFIQRSRNAKEATLLINFAREKHLNVDRAIAALRGEGRPWRRIPSEWLTGDDGKELMKALELYCWETWQPRRKTER